MLRTIASVVLGYVAMVFLVILSIAACWFGLGNEFAFEGESNRASVGWSLIILSGGFAAAIVAGCITAKVAGAKCRSAATKGLVGVILVLGLLSAISSFTMTPTPMPEGKSIRDLTFTEAGQYARSPAWYEFAIIVVGMGGVYLGSRICTTNAPAPKIHDDPA
jgi:hypothetical protein